MKTLMTAAAALTLMMSCNVSSDVNLPFGLTVKEGNGPTTTREHMIDFDEIRVAQSIRAEIIKADREKVVITAPADIIDDVLVEKSGDKVHIHFKPNLNISARNVSAKVYAKDFSAVEASSSARIDIRDTFTQDRVNVSASSSASINGNLEANDLSIKCSSSGSFSGKIWAVNLDGKTSSSGDITISGKTKNAVLAASSSGTLNAADVIADNAEIKASSSGSVQLALQNRLVAAASSSGSINIFQRGNLQIAERKESSGGRVTVR